MQLFSYQMQMLLPTMEKLASVKDSRAKFFKNGDLAKAGTLQLWVVGAPNLFTSK